MRLIDADKINVKQWFAFPDNRKTMAESLAAAPTVDAVPVIRCKDCKHWGTGIAGEIDGIKCCKIAGYMVTLSGYCVYGEMKNND